MVAVSLGLASFGHRLWRGGVGPEPQARREVAGGSRLLCGAGGSLALRPASCPRPPRSQWGVGVLLQRLQEGSVGPQGACPSWRYSTCAPRATFPGTVPKAPGAAGCPVPTPSAGASWTVTVWRADAAPGRGLGPRTRGAPIRRSALCPGMRGWPGEAALRGWARGRAAGEAPSPQAAVPLGGARGDASV